MKAFIKTIIKQGVQFYYNIAGSKVECNICHYKASRLMSDQWHEFSVCPRCWSGVRQRLLWAMLTTTETYHLNKLIKGKKVLHFAPEKLISKLIAPLASSYKTADFLAEGYTDAYHHIDYNMDISDMYQLKDSEYDCIIACDVLEHVYDDTRALSEICRVLSNGGCCILTVPQKDHLEKTFEDISITDPKERETNFGQSDHVRIYGKDFLNKIELAGFKVEQIDENAFPEKKRKRNVLYPPVLSKHPLATNYRKIFIGHKA